MALERILYLLSKNERSRLQSAAISRQELARFYVAVHRDVSFFLASELDHRRTDSAAAVLQIAKSAATMNFINRRIEFLDNAIERHYAQANDALLHTLEGQIRREFRAFGFKNEPKLQRHLIDAALTDAMHHIRGWNALIAREFQLMIRQSIRQGEDLKDLRAKIIAPNRVRRGPKSPVARARQHMAANTQYAVSRAANDVRLDAYNTLRKETGVVIRKMWWSKLENSCVSCTLLHGQVVGLSAQFPWEHLNLPTTPYHGTLHQCPLHPYCSCRNILVPANFLDDLDLRQLIRDREERLSRLRQLVA